MQNKTNMIKYKLVLFFIFLFQYIISFSQTWQKNTIVGLCNLASNQFIDPQPNNSLNPKFRLTDETHLKRVMDSLALRFYLESANGKLDPPFRFENNLATSYMGIGYKSFNVLGKDLNLHYYFSYNFSVLKNYLATYGISNYFKAMILHELGHFALHHSTTTAVSKKKEGTRCR